MNNFSLINADFFADLHRYISARISVHFCYSSARKKLLIGSFIIIVALQATNIFGQNNIKPKNFKYQPSLYYQYEQGVSNRLSLQNIISYKHNSIIFSLGWRFHFNEQLGLGSFSLALNEWKTPIELLSFGGEYQYHEYPDYNIGENMFAFLSYFKTGEKVRLGAGFTYRSPQITENKIHSPFLWGGTLDELYFIAQIKWDIIKKEKYKLTSKIGTYDFTRIQTMDHAFIKLENTYKLKENIQLRADVSTAIKGFSGLLFAINEFRFNAGLSFYY